MAVGNPNQYSVYGQAVLDQGLCVLDGIDGAGLVTRGLVYPGPSIWYDQLQRYSGYSIGTGWTAALGYSGSASAYSTSWSAASGYSGSATLISTGWTSSIYSVYGEFPATQ